MTPEILARFLSKIQVQWPDGATARWKDADDYCWLWTAARTAGGYGEIKIGGRKGKLHYAHRLSYEHYVGPIPAGLQIDHLCRNRACVNPAQLEAVTSRENGRRGLKGVALTHCPSGHAYDEANTGRISTSGWRYCRACAREKMRRRARERKVA